VYRLTESPPLCNPDLVTVATCVLGEVICLVSALAFHELTAQIPHDVHPALLPCAREPRFDSPPIKTYRFAGKSNCEGVQIHTFDNVSVRICSPTASASK
jgi:predicted transcriptional regulator of viral defense system